MDVYSRYVVGWMVAPRESAELAKLLIEETCIRQGIEEDQLTLHAAVCLHPLCMQNIIVNN
jgi:putative transposase